MRVLLALLLALARAAWSESWIFDRLAALNDSVPTFAYAPAIIDGFPGTTLLKDLPDPQEWTLDGITHLFWPQCGQTVAQHNTFEMAWHRYVALHHQIAQGSRPPRFVHVAFPPDAGIQLRMRVIAAATLLGLVTDRALTISWVPTPKESGMAHEPLIKLFRSPGFDWWYATHKYADEKFDRFNVYGFGQEMDNTSTHEPQELMCEDVTLLQQPWLELHWKYDGFAAAVYHNPAVLNKVQEWMPPDDIYGPLMRKLFFPVRKLWKTVEKVYKKHMDKVAYRTSNPGVSIKSGAIPSLSVVALEIERPDHVNQIHKCVESMGFKPRYTEPRQTDAGLLVTRHARFFLQTGSQPQALARLEKVYGKDRTFAYKNTDTANDGERWKLPYPTDAREIIDEFLLQFSDVVMAPVNTERLRHQFFSQRSLQYDGTGCKADIQCQICFHWNKTEIPCWKETSKLARIPMHRTCLRSLWYRW